jgi:hypothetical protein
MLTTPLTPRTLKGAPVSASLTSLPSLKPRLTANAAARTGEGEERASRYVGRSKDGRLCRDLGRAEGGRR